MRIFVIFKMSSKASSSPLLSTPVPVINHVDQTKTQPSKQDVLDSLAHLEAKLACMEAMFDSSSLWGEVSQLFHTIKNRQKGYRVVQN